MTTLTPSQHQEAARQLLEAERNVSPVVQLAKTYPGMDIDDAYAIQLEAIGTRRAAGAVLRGHKIGLTSKAMQASNAQIEETGLAAGVMGHPAMGIVWLANRLAACDTTLEAGQVVLAGSFTRPVAARAGDSFHVDYGPLGSVACAFTRE